MIKLKGLKSVIKVYYVKTDHENGAGQSMFRVGGKSAQPSSASMKIQMTQKTAIWMEASLRWVEQRSLFSPRSTINQAMKCTPTDFNI